MTYADTLVALLIAGAAMYGLGLPLAWLLPAPAQAAWVYRIAIAPVYAILLASLAALVLGRVGVPLEPILLLLMGVAAWAVAWWRTRGQWGIRAALRRAGVPASLVALAGLGWVGSLVGFGLYLPNRDFKNHAYFVAQVAWTRSADLPLVLRRTPVAEPASTGYYPLGLHTLLGWALPWSDGNTVALTAAAAVLATAISAPLAFVALARMWDPASGTLAFLAGIGAVVLPGVTETFEIGSVAVLVATAMYAAGLVTLWIWVQAPTPIATVSLLLVGLGLFVLHVAEGVGLGLLALVCLPTVARRIGHSPSNRGWLLIAAFSVPLIGVVAAGAWRLSGQLGDGASWDIQPNVNDPATALIVSVLQLPGGRQPVATVVWIVLAVAGFGMARSRRMSQFPLAAVAVPIVLGMLAGARGIPPLVGVLTAPWYGSASRMAFMAAAPVTLAGSLALAGILARAHRRSGRLLAAAVCAAVLAAFAVQLVPGRRADLRESLAGAGDSISVARALSSRLSPGSTVLNLEGDGTASLFAYSRVPVLSAWYQDPSLQRGSQSLTDLLLDLDDPNVAAWLADLKVQFIVLGTGSSYWGSDAEYDWQDVGRQPQVTTELQGTDMIVLRYVGGELAGTS